MGNTASNPENSQTVQNNEQVVNDANGVSGSQEPIVASTETNSTESTPIDDSTQQSTQPTQPVQPAQPVQPVQMSQPQVTTISNVRPRPKYVHPFISMIERNSSEAEMINTLQAFCGRVQIGCDQYGRPIYEAVDQTEFIGPVLQVFSYCATNGRKNVVQWLLDNFVPLQVSYDNNFCYHECSRWKHLDIADMLCCHESFVPEVSILFNLLERSRYNVFRTCIQSPHLRGDFQTYRYTFLRYIDTSDYEAVKSLLSKINQRISGQTVEITDTVYPNPRLVPQQNSQTIVAEPVPTNDTTETTETTEPTEMTTEPTTETTTETTTDETVEPMQTVDVSVPEVVIGSVTESDEMTIEDGGLHHRNTFTAETEN